MKDKLKEAILNIYPDFPTAELSTGLELFRHKQFSAKEHMLKEGAVSNKLFFAESSVSRCYYTDQEGEQQTLWMKPQQTFITDFKSFTNQSPSQFNLQFYEDTVAYSISRKDLVDLYKTYKGWALFGVYLTEKLHVTLIDVFVNLLSNDATQNYRYIEYAFPKFIQVAPLKDIASMLQISQVSLSRIRSGTQVKK